MTALQTFCQWLYDLPASEALRESDDVFPIVETIHVLGICLMVGTIATVDLRLSGVLVRGQRAARISRALLPYTWAGFALMFVTGLPLFAAEAAKLYGNPAFRLKLLLLLFAGGNALLFHKTTRDSPEDRDLAAPVPLRTRMFACTSLLLWFAIVVSGRLIAVYRAH
jgi:hypothetical protein